MKQACFLLLALLLSAFAVQGQNNDCNCGDNLARLVVKTEENYAGFPAKVNARTQASYDQLLSRLRRQTATETRPKACFYLLKEYVRFFADKHFILSYVNEADADRTMREIQAFDPPISSATRQNEPWLGGWLSADSTLRLQVVKAGPGRYDAVVVRSAKPSEPPRLVFMTLQKVRQGWVAKLYNSFLTTDIPARLSGCLLHVWNQHLFRKLNAAPLSPEQAAEWKSWQSDMRGLRFRQLSAKTTCVSIPSFYNNDAQIAGFLAQHDAAIRAADNLIIDLRGNGGGSTGWVALLPYLMTKPILQADTYLRVTPENVQAKLADLQPFAVNPIPEEYKKYFPDSVVAAYKKAYQELPTTKEAFYPIPGVPFPLDSILARPKTVALLVDDFCGSSTEYFLLLSRQSGKTISYGSHTIGMMDYEGMSNPTALPYASFILTIPIVQSSWTTKAPIDRTGCKPMNSLTHLPHTQWLRAVQQAMESR